MKIRRISTVNNYDTREVARLIQSRHELVMGQIPIAVFEFWNDRYNFLLKRAHMLSHNSFFVSLFVLASSHNEQK